MSREIMYAIVTRMDVYSIPEEIGIEEFRTWFNDDFLNVPHATRDICKLGGLSRALYVEMLDDDGFEKFLELCRDRE